MFVSAGKNRVKIPTLLAALLVTGTPSMAAEATKSLAVEAAEENAKRIAWWKEARFGMFVHWGIYSVTGGQYRGQELPNSAEWMMARGKIPIAEYEQYAARFNPTKFDATKFVGLAKQAGMKYLVITAKHHDGFSLFHSHANRFNVVEATPFKRDIMRELADACAEQGIRFGFYYSQAQDWHHPGGFGNGWDKTIQRVSSDLYVNEKAAPEVKQLLSEYGPIGIFWWDTPRNMSREAFEKLAALTSTQAATLTNDRLGKDYPGDYKTFERKIPRQVAPGKEWEVCMPISGSWGYKSSDKNFKSVSTLIRNLADIASKGGNYLLNVSPTAEGILLPESVQRLEAIGKWMQTNSEAIYGTDASPLGKLDWGRCTRKEADGKTTLYLHVFDWPLDGKLVVLGLKNQVEQAYLLADKTPLATSQQQGWVAVSLPTAPPDAINSVVVVQIEGTLEVETVLPKIGKHGQLSLAADQAFLHNNEGSADIRLSKREEGSYLGYWTDPEAWVEWSFQCEQPGTYQITAELAMEAPASTFRVAVSGAEITTTAVSTGSYGNYAGRVLGQIDISHPGTHSLSIRPVKESWQPINLRSVTLRQK